ncbi:gliding motility protein GldL [Roseivirga sp. BDSF3-8]|uniref:type IX secretion system motor protein PorL/GldL n=1 Tax=Roseivirga sp. BDSF3-8 TaxID=3241598 RepID=UPI003531EF48
MSRNKGGFKELFYGSVMPKIYGIGAAVVIVGAMFKILHWEGANIMLVVGLTTEAAIFFLSSFEPKGSEYDWSRVYPELSEEFDGPVARKKVQNGSSDSVSKKLDHMLESSKVGPELVDSLGKGMKNLSDSVGKMANLSNAAVATEEYAQNVKTASKSLVEMNKSYGTTLTAMSEMTTASKDAKEYHAQVQSVTKNLSALNAVYELELNDANNHLKAMNKFYNNLSGAMENMSQASKESEQFKTQMSQLTTNIGSLNKVYGNMLSAMKG